MPDYICLSHVYPKYIPYIRDLNRIIRGYPWDIPDYVCLSLVLFFLQKTSSTGRLVQQIRRRPGSASTTNHGVSLLFVQLKFLDAFAGCPAHWRLTNEYLHGLEPDSGLGVWLINLICVSHPSHEQECPGRNQGKYKWPNAACHEVASRIFRQCWLLI